MRTPERSTSSSRTRREYYGRELEYKLKKLTSLFEPAVIIFMGSIVGFVAVALISAMYGVFNSSKCSHRPRSDEVTRRTRAAPFERGSPSSSCSS